MLQLQRSRYQLEEWSPGKWGVADTEVPKLGSIYRAGLAKMVRVYIGFQNRPTALRMAVRWNQRAARVNPFIAAAKAHSRFRAANRV